MNALIFSCICFVLFYGVTTLDNPEAKPKVESFDVHLKMSRNQLERYFGVSSLADVPDYDISYPVYVDGKGERISKTRAKRDTDISGVKYYQMTAFGKKLRLNVTLNKNLLGPNFYIETRNKDGSRTISDAPHRNFYHGHLLSDPEALVAISDYRGVSGAIRVTDDEMLFFEPLPRHLSTHDHSKEPALPHLVVKRSAKEFQDKHHKMFEREEYPRRDEQDIAELPMESDLTVQSDKHEHRFYEVLYAGDYLITEQIGLRELPEMLLIIGNIVARMYTDTTFGEIKLTYVVTKLIIFNNGELNYYRNASNGQKLDAFGRWLLKNNPASDDDPEHVDTGTLFTSNTGGGLALSGGMCSYRDMKAVVGSIGLSSSAIAAHENFHNLGFGHDGNSPECPNGANIMSTYVPSGKGAFTWSNCSRRYIQKYLRSRWSQCLKDSPTAKRPSLPPLIRDKLPGVIFDGDKQCEYKHTLGSKQCSVSCSTLFCSTNGGSCYSTGGAPAEGTRCGDGKWCIRGKCVDNGGPPVDGSWGSWSQFSECSRTCGVGVRHRVRKCNNPSPKNGGKPCLGSDKSREDETCNTHKCPVGSTSFRELQCKAKEANNRPFIRKGAECYLWCWAKNGYGYLHGQVIDGTRCYNNPEKTDICVRGECQALGCDKTLSEAENDRCAVCNGDGSSCELRIKNYTKYHNMSGYDKADTMVVLKKGYKNIHAKMMGITTNTIGVQDKIGRYLIKLPSRTKTVNHAGMKITYIHRRKMYDEIIITGNVTEELKLVFIHNGPRNQGVKIQYYAPIISSTKPPQDIFYWETGDWSTCSRTCGEGISRRNVKCFRRDDHSRAGNTFCVKTIKPPSEKSCTVQQCPAEWHSYVTQCSKTCGKGIEIRKTICRRKNGDFWVAVNDSECVGPPPTKIPFKRYCNEIACPPEYVATPWSECSTTCGEGVLTRALKCRIINNEGGITVLPVETCEHYKLTKPSTKKKCNYDKPCKAKPKFVGIGCFKDGGDNDRLLINMIANIRPQIDWKNPNATITKCASLAQEHKADYFAVQFYGECWASPEGIVPRYDKYGKSTNCWSGLGGTWTNYVYKFTKN